MSGFEFLAQSVPELTYFSSLEVVCGVILFSLLRYGRVKKTKTIIYTSILIEYLFLILCSTVLMREAKVTYHAELCPFWNYRDALTFKDHNDFLEILMNVLVFIPVGFLFPLTFRKSKLWKLLSFAILFSAIIEILQYILHRGLAETDDVIHNTLGAVIGFVIYRIMFPYYRKLKKQ